MFLLVSAALATLPGSSATWSPLTQSPVRIECTTWGGQPYCRSTGVIGVSVATASSTFAELDRYVSRMGAITRIDRLEKDVLRVVMDYPFPLSDRDYVARFTHRTEGTTEVYAWVPVTHPSAPDTGDTVRLTWLDGEWRFSDEGGNTRVTYVWQADPGGGLPDVSAVRSKAGYLAVADMANACATKILGP